MILKVNNQNINYKIDTGSGVCPKSDQLYYNEFNKIILQKTGPKLLVPGRNIKNYLGIFTSSILYRIKIYICIKIYKYKVKYL